MELAKDKLLYKVAKDWADRTYKVPGAYKSMAIQKKYMELFKEKYGEAVKAYIGNTKGGKLQHWRNEKWTDVDSYLKGTPKKCGSVPYNNKKSYVACRPMKTLVKTPKKILQEKLIDKKKLKHEMLKWVYPELHPKT